MEMIVEMSKSVQFLFVSHNKLTMEIADQPVGVTMKNQVCQEWSLLTSSSTSTGGIGLN